jgi:PII-like signaling protein
MSAVVRERRMEGTGMDDSGQREEAHGHDGFEQMQQVSVYIGEGDHYQQRPLYLKILELARDRGLAGATVLKGLAGFSSSSRSLHISGLADIRQDLPLLVIIVDSAPQVERILPELEKMVQANGGLITVQDLEAHRYVHPSLPHGRKHGLWPG